VRGLLRLLSAPFLSAPFFPVRPPAAGYQFAKSCVIQTVPDESRVTAIPTSV
jgi:hypothetical protein